jgi:PhnB protein
MSEGKSYIRHGLGAVRPYLYGNPELPAFLTSVFGAEIVESTLNRSGGSHVEMRLADSVFVIETGKTLADAPRSSVYVYVEDAAATYRQALQNGATSVAEPSIKPYGELEGGFKDAFGNTWWIGTYRGSK